MRRPTCWSARSGTGQSCPRRSGAPSYKGSPAGDGKEVQSKAKANYADSYRPSCCCFDTSRSWQEHANIRGNAKSCNASATAASRAKVRHIRSKLFLPQPIPSCSRVSEYPWRPSNAGPVSCLPSCSCTRLLSRLPWTAWTSWLCSSGCLLSSYEFSIPIALSFTV